ncbi:MAG: hypothetical protein GEU28_10790 [Dehalococcoidia bacterium]|nr:hypothetical protein [Dehalococcoidia bacterium]
MLLTGNRTIDAIFDAINQHDAAAMSRYYAAEARVWLVGVKNEMSAGGFETHARLLAAMPDTKVEVLNMSASGPLVFVEWTRQGTHTGRFEQLAPTNNTVVLRGVSVYRLSGEKVTEERIYVDSQDLYGQLSVPRKRSGAG